MATNLLAAPEDFTDAEWTDTNTTVTADQATAPDGTTTADDIIHTTSAAVLFDNSITTAADTAHTFSLFAKQGATGSAQWVSLWFRTASGANGPQVWFDIVNGVIGTTTNQGTGATASGSAIQLVEQDYWWLSVAGILPTSVTLARVNIHIADGDASTTELTSGSIYAWGAQLHEGAVAQPYSAVSGATIPSQGIAFVRDLTRDLVSDVTTNLVR